nr:PF20097 family protein [Maliibacterium massiliense]
MQCPYCHEEMIKGRILGDRYQLKWMPKDKKLILGLYAHDSIALGYGGGMGRPEVDADYCPRCKKMLVDV